MSARVAGLARRVRLDVPARRAFAAVGTLAGIRGWWTPLATGSTKEGSLLTLRFRGLDETIRFRVETCRAPSTARWLCLGHDTLPEWAGTRLWFTVRPRGDASSLELVHEGLVPALDCYESCRAGWHHFVDSLAAWAEGGRGRPFASRERSDSDAAYGALARGFADDPRVTLPTERRGKFGGNGLKVDGKVFAMWVRGALVVKLPRSEIDAAVAAARGERLSMGPGRVMKEWLVVHEARHRWPAIARRARAFVAGEIRPREAELTVGAGHRRRPGGAASSEGRRSEANQGPTSRPRRP